MTTKYGPMLVERAVLTLKEEEMNHPPEVWKDPSYATQSLEELLVVYLEHLRGGAKQRSPRTVDKYEQCIRDYFKALQAQNAPLELSQLTPYTVSRWIFALREKGLVEDSIAPRLSALKTFSRKYIWQYLELTTQDLLAKIPRISPPEREMSVLTNAQLKQILALYNRPTFEDIRNKAFVSMFIYTPLRYNEVLNMTVSGFDRLTGEFSVIAKGNQERPAKLHETARKYVQRYLGMRHQYDSDHLWIVSNGKRLSYFGGQMIFRRLSEALGFNVHPHMFRHRFAQGALLQGAHPGQVQEMLGHKSPAMTRRYSGLVKQQLAAEQMAQYAPRI